MSDIKVTKLPVVEKPRDARGRRVNVGSEGYKTMLDTSGVRFSGSVGAKRQLVLSREAANATEPDWTLCRPDELDAAEKMAIHRLSGGEVKWKRIIENIRRARLGLRR